MILDKRSIAQLFAETLCDPRTIRRAYEGERINIATRERLRMAAEKLNIEPPPLHVKGALS